jgi:endo-beta-N-acetylglucosaminidase D
VQANGYNTAVNWSGLFPEGAPHVVSLGFYRPEWTFRQAANQADFYQRDNRFWVGANADPSNTNTASPWKGMAHYVPASSPITRLPFVTNFNTGQGHFYAINGRPLSKRDWNNLSLQDVLPTWRWIMQSAGTRLTPALDWTDAYYGGTCLKVSGDLGAPNDLKLFQTRLPIDAQTTLRIAFRTGESGLDTAMKVGLTFEDDLTHVHLLDVGSAPSADWNTRTFGLGSFAGRTLAVISLRFQSGSTVPNYSIRVGQIAVLAGGGHLPDAPSGAVVDGKTETDATHAALRLKWEHSLDPVYYYNVYRRNPNALSTYLGGTPNNAYFVPSVARVGSEASTTIEIEAVGLDFRHSRRATTTFTWDAPPPSSTLDF